MLQEFSGTALFHANCVTLDDKASAWLLVIRGGLFVCLFVFLHVIFMALSK